MLVGLLIFIAYVIIAIIGFYILSYFDVFDEYVAYKYMEFPSKTFTAATLWIIFAPIAIVCIILEKILTSIEITGYVIRDIAKSKKSKKNK